jgi:hypothetical protein
MHPSTTPTTPYFPPPPKHATKAKRASKSPEETRQSPPQTLRRSRQFLLPTLLVLTFITTVLSMIYAYCIAAPHTSLTKEDLLRDAETEIDDSIFRRAVTLLRRGSSYGSGDGSPDAAMIAYTLSAPVATLIYILSELAMHVTRPHVSVTRRFHLIFLCCTLLIAAGWITTVGFWAQCEMPAPSLTENIYMCPASVRGHFMFGIHELSIAKVIVSFFIIVGLLLHAYCIVKNMRDIRRFGGDGLGIKHGSVRMVLEMEEGARVQRDLRRGFKKHGVRIAEGY